jgi:hypothetical protein
MRPQRLDTTLAYKAISLAAELSGTEKRVAAAILDSFNRKNGQCDPSLGRIAHLLNINRRTVIRALRRIEKSRFIEKDRHGGKFHRNSYKPNWVRFREAEVVWNAHQKTQHWNSDVLNVSPSEWKNCHVAGVNNATQTLRINQSHETLVAGTTSEGPQRSRPLNVSRTIGLKTSVNGIAAGMAQSTSGSAEAALAAAERRWCGELNRRYSRTPEIYAEIIAAIDPAMQRGATEAEMRKGGAGMRFIHDELKRNSIGGDTKPNATALGQSGIALTRSGKKS